MAMRQLVGAALLALLVFGHTAEATAAEGTRCSFAQSGATAPCHSHIGPSGSGGQEGLVGPLHSWPTCIACFKRIAMHLQAVLPAASINTRLRLRTSAGTALKNLMAKWMKGVPAEPLERDLEDPDNPKKLKPVNQYWSTWVGKDPCTAATPWYGVDCFDPEKTTPSGDPIKRPAVQSM
jgi:hypothetical protein